MYESKDIIRNRMMRHISRLWGYPGTESEEAFDPILGMLVGACSAELEKINKEIGFSQNRITEHLARLFVPDAETRAIPAHSVVHLPASNVEDVIEKNAVFYFNKTMHNKSGDEIDEKRLSFIPTINAQIHKAEIKYLITNEYLYKQMEGRYKDIYAQALSKDINSSCFYIGISCETESRNLNGLSIYFELDEQRSIKDKFFENLKYAKFSINKKEIKANIGYANYNKDKSLMDKISLNQSLFEKKINEINDFYAPQFVSIDSIENIQSKLKNCPDDKIEFFESELIDELEENLLWLKIEFPSIVTASTLSHLSCHLNCVPVVNCKLKTETMNLHPQLNIKALLSDDFFYDINKVEDNNGNLYGLSNLLQSTNNDTDNEESYEYILRNTGVGRMDQREASEMLEDLINILKEESVAFTMHDTTKLHWHVDELNKQIVTLENLVENKTKGESITYLMLPGHKKDDKRYLLIKYWETAGEQANNLKKGTPFKISGNTPFSGKSAILLNRTHYGRSCLSGEEKLNAFKKAYICSNRIVTLLDVKESVKGLLGNKAKKVKVEKCVVPGIDTKHGFKRIIKITIKPEEQFISGNKEEKEAIERQIINHLRINSSAMLNFDVIIN